MPIKGLTDRQAAFPQIGILRKGETKQNEKAPGRDLTYFRFTSEHADVHAAFVAAYGDKPTDIHVLLPYRTTDENLASWREDWVAGGLVHRCDGETCVIWRKSDGTYSTDPKPCPGKCKPVGRLAVIVPELKRLAFVTVLTTSIHDISTLSENLTALEMVRSDLRGIPMILRRRPRKVGTPGQDGKRVRREKWLLSIEADPGWVAYHLSTQQAAALPRLADGSLPELMAPDDENDIVFDGTTGAIVNTTTAPDWFDPAEEGPPPAEPPQPEPAKPATPAANGKPPEQPRINLATVRATGWKEAALALAGDVAYYRKDGGMVDWFHLTGAAAKLGYAEITDANLADVIGALRQYAADNEALQAEQVPL